MANLTNPLEIRILCEKYGFSFSKNLGQNFLINPGICPKICDTAHIDKQTNVLEVGPGFGTLTQQLAIRAKKVVAVEIDTRLLPVLEETLADFDNTTIINEDILKCHLNNLIQDKLEGKASVCANLPYYITSPIIMYFLENRLPITSITAMVQKEAAQRMTAKPGTKLCGAISYAIWYWCTPSISFNVKPGSFYPPPKVESSVIHLIVRENPPLATKPEHEKRLFKLIQAAFSMRRKTLVNAVSKTLKIPKEPIQNALNTLSLSPLIRPEQMTLENYIDLENILSFLF